MKLSTFYKLYPDFAANGSESVREQVCNVAYWDVLADAPASMFLDEYAARCDDSDVSVMEFRNVSVPDADVHGLVRRVREALGRKAPAPTVCRYKREMLAPELLAVACAAVSEGETYAPQNAWAIALFQAAELADGQDRSDDIAVCCAQYERLEGRPICSETPDVWDVRAE